MAIEILGDVLDVRTIASGRGVEQRGRLDRLYGSGRWRKLKGVALVRFPDRRVRWVELHWYEAHGIGRVEPKVKLILEQRP